MALPTLNNDDPASALAAMAQDNETKLSRLIDISEDMLAVLIKDFQEQKEENEENDFTPDYDEREYLRRVADRESMHAESMGESGLFRRLMDQSKSGLSKTKGFLGEKLGSLGTGLLARFGMSGAAANPVAIGVGVGAIALGLFSFIWPWIRESVIPILKKGGELIDRLHAWLSKAGIPQKVVKEGAASMLIPGWGVMKSIENLWGSGGSNKGNQQSMINNTTINNITNGGGGGGSIAILPPISGNIPRPSAFAIQA